SLLESNVARLRNHRSTGRDTNVFGKSACPYPEDFIARLELGDVPADRFNCSGEVRSRRRVFRLTKSKDKSADTTLQHSAIVKSEGNGANPDKNLVVVRNRLFDLFKFQNLIGRTVLTITYRFHGIGRSRSVAIAVVGRSPIGDLEPREENDKGCECAPVQ